MSSALPRRVSVAAGNLYSTGGMHQGWAHEGTGKSSEVPLGFGHQRTALPRSAVQARQALVLVGDQYTGVLSILSRMMRKQINEEHSADHIVNIPATAKEEREGKDKKLARMDTFKTY